MRTGRPVSGDLVARRRALLSPVLNALDPLRPSDDQPAGAPARGPSPAPTLGTRHDRFHSPSRHPRARAAGRAAQTARRYALNPNLSALLPRRRTPTWARLAGDARLDVWLISWPEGTETGWHDHGEASGAFAVASGLVLEQTWALGAVQQRTLAEGDARAFGRDHVHNVVGAGPGRAPDGARLRPGLVTWAGSSSAPTARTGWPRRRTRRHGDRDRRASATRRSTGRRGCSRGRSVRTRRRPPTSATVDDLRRRGPRRPTTGSRRGPHTSCCCTAARSSSTSGPRPSGARRARSTPPCGPSSSSATSSSGGWTRAARARLPWTSYETRGPRALPGGVCVVARRRDTWCGWG
jgi:hypothetical protein